MKSITAGLLLVLLAVHCCDASPHAVKSGPDQCCFRFFDKRIPKAQILSIEKTHIKCSTPAFVVKTPKGDFCVRQTEQWAVGSGRICQTPQLTHQQSAVTLTNATS